jgi:hypothetical protein
LLSCIVEQNRPAEGSHPYRGFEAVFEDQESRRKKNKHPYIAFSACAETLPDIMCYFDQTRWTCGYWRWGHFRQQCNKEYRMGETCGLKLVYETRSEGDICKLCHDMEKKQRRYDKMYRDVQRWQREGGRPATVERTCGEMQEVLGQIYRLNDEHNQRLQSLGQ